MFVVEKLICAVTERDLVALTVLSQIKDMFGHHFAHSIGIGRSSKPIARCLNLLPRIFEGIAEKIIYGLCHNGRQLTHQVKASNSGASLVVLICSSADASIQYGSDFAEHGGGPTLGAGLIQVGAVEGGEPVQFRQDNQ